MLRQQMMTATAPSPPPSQMVQQTMPMPPPPPVSTPPMSTTVEFPAQDVRHRAQSDAEAQPVVSAATPVVSSSVPPTEPASARSQWVTASEAGNDQDNDPWGSSSANEGPPPLPKQASANFWNDRSYNRRAQWRDNSRSGSNWSTSGDYGSRWKSNNTWCVP